MINVEHSNLSIRKQSTLLSVWRSNIYYKPKSSPDESILANEIHELWLSMPYYGYRRVTAELRRRGYEINHKKVLRIMKDMHIQALYPKPKTSLSNSEHKKYPYLLRNLEIKQPNHVWEMDITYIKLPTGFVYLIGIIDVHSRFLVAWALSNSMETELCLEALDNALRLGKKPEILNTDQGSQFTSFAWVNRVEQQGIKVSMDGIGRWADNIFIERFWRTLKYEHILLHSFETIKSVREGIIQFVETYNHKRLHQSLGYKTPAAVYMQ